MYSNFWQKFRKTPNKCHKYAQMKSRAPKSSNQTFKHCILFKHRSSLKEQTLCPKGQFLTVDYELQIGQSGIIFDKIFCPCKVNLTNFLFAK